MDEKLPPPSPEEQEQRLETERVTRRSFLMNVGIALNAAVAIAIATPVVGYLLGPVLRRKDYLQWISLGETAEFTPGETRLVTFRDPFANSWDGDTANIRPMFGAPSPASSRCLRSTVPILAARCAGSPSRNCSCVPAMAVSTMLTAAVPPDRRNVASSLMNSRWRAASS